jgi:predicted nuclease with TOPRIM domain
MTRIRRCGVCILAFELLKTKTPLSREEYVERFTEYDAQFNQMEERMEALEWENTVLKEAVVTHHNTLREMEDQVRAPG